HKQAERLLIAVASHVRLLERNTELVREALTYQSLGAAGRQAQERVGHFDALCQRMRPQLALTEAEIRLVARLEFRGPIRIVRVTVQRRHAERLCCAQLKASRKLP